MVVDEVLVLVYIARCRSSIQQLEKAVMACVLQKKKKETKLQRHKRVELSKSFY
jgi:hypothetical protein